MPGRVYGELLKTSRRELSKYPAGISPAGRNFLIEKLREAATRIDPSDHVAIERAKEQLEKLIRLAKQESPGNPISSKTLAGILRRLCPHFWPFCADEAD